MVRFELYKDKYQWILTTFRPIVTKDGKEGLSKKKTYHPTFRQVATYMVGVECEGAVDIESLPDLFDRAAESLASRLEVKVRECL